MAAAIHSSPKASRVATCPAQCLQAEPGNLWYPLVSHGRLGFAHHFGAAEHAWHSVAKPSEGAQSLLASTSPAGEQSAMDSVGQAAPQLKQRRVGSTVKSNGR